MEISSYLPTNKKGPSSFWSFSFLHFYLLSKKCPSWCVKPETLLFHWEINIHMHSSCHFDSCLVNRHGSKWCFIYMYLLFLEFLVQMTWSWMFMPTESVVGESPLSHIHNTQQIWSHGQILLSYFKNDFNICIT